MAKFTGLEGHLSVKNLEEAFSFYKRVFGMNQVPHHGYDILTLNGKHFYSIFEMSAEEAKAYEMSSKTKFCHMRLKACLEVETEREVQNIAQAVMDEGGKGEPAGPRPWSPYAADVVDKYGVEWFISMPMHEPPEGCLACVPIDEEPGCDLCIRWSEVDFVCPKI